MPRPIRPWYRAYVEMFHDRKVRRLPPAQRWLWAAILGASRESCEPGRLYVAPGEPMTRQEIADYAGVPIRDVNAGLEAMARMSMVGIEDGLVTVLNWNSRQFESDDVTKRTRTHRERSPEPRRNVPGNAPETETETETEEVHSSAPADGDFDRFWAAYPRRVAKGAARRAWKAALKKVPGPDVLVEAASAYTASVASTRPEFVKHPASWLNGECWTDEPLGAPDVLPPVEESWMRRRRS